MTDRNDENIIEEFRSNEGTVGDFFEGAHDAAAPLDGPQDPSTCPTATAGSCSAPGAALRPTRTGCGTSR
jgi:hypothetical protein